MSNSRDTQFTGFAQLLLDDLMNADHAGIHTSDDEALGNHWKTIIARRAYDLALHVLVSPNGLDRRRAREDEAHYRAHVEEILRDDVPDLTEWPKQEKGTQA